jgi:hypothetical protein
MKMIAQRQTSVRLFQSVRTEMSTTTNEKVRVHPASPVKLVAVVATEPCGCNNAAIVW